MNSFIEINKWILIGDIMGQFELIATTTFGIEGVVKREIINLGFKVIKTENGKVTFLSDEAGIAKANLWLRTADRVLLKVGEFKAFTFDELFDKTIALDWSKYIPENGKFTVNGKSVKSKLFSISDCQAIVKKSIVENLKKKYNTSWFSESGANYTVLISILKDVATLTIDTSGVALHKRGYRINSVEAPLKETLGATLVLLSYWNKDRTLYDVFCGSGTIPIEAAMIGRNIAPGLSRDFASKHWSLIGEKIWKEEIKKAFQAIDHNVDLNIYASDINERNLNAAIENVGKLEVYQLERGLPTLATSAGAAPMIGFLGTVIGMIRAFWDMSNAGSNIDVSILSHGIYTAMVTTAAGLFVGIVAYFCYNILVAKIDKVVFLLEARSSEFMDLLNEPVK